MASSLIALYVNMYEAEAPTHLLSIVHPWTSRDMYIFKNQAIQHP